MKVEFNKVFQQANQTRKRYRILMGSAASGKSVNVATDYILKLSDKQYEGCNLLVVRGIEGAHQNSTYAELCAAVGRLHLSSYWQITKNPLYMRCLVTGNTIIFRGFNDMRARERVKSINFPTGKLCWIWVEEATELKQDDIEILDDRLRGQLPNPNLYYQMTLTFNPVSAQHWIKKKFWDYESEDILKCHSTYLDNRFIDEGFKKRMLMRKEQDPEGYRIYGLGEWGETGGLILTNYTVKELKTEHSFYDSIVYSQDFGFNHADCILEMGFKDDNIFVLSEIYEYNKDTEELIQIANNRGIDKKKLMYCDSAEPDRIQMWKRAGFKALPVSKEKNSVTAQIDYLKQHKIYINCCCTNTIKEIQQWKWIKDNVTGEFTDEPVNFFDDAMAALRYGIEPYRKNIRLKTYKNIL